jgi:hypothetical protein
MIDMDGAMGMERDETKHKSACARKSGSFLLLVSLRLEADQRTQNLSLRSTNGLAASPW